MRLIALRILLLRGHPPDCLCFLLPSSPSSSPAPPHYFLLSPSSSSSPLTSFSLLITLSGSGALSVPISLSLAKGSVQWLNAIRQRSRVVLINR